MMPRTLILALLFSLVACNEETPAPAQEAPLSATWNDYDWRDQREYVETDGDTEIHVWTAEVDEYADQIEFEICDAGTLSIYADRHTLDFGYPGAGPRAVCRYERALLAPEGFAFVVLGRAVVGPPGSGPVEVRAHANVRWRVIR